MITKEKYDYLLGLAKDLEAAREKDEAADRERAKKNGKLFGRGLIRLADCEVSKETWQKRAKLKEALASLPEEELRDMGGLMAIGRNVERLEDPAEPFGGFRNDYRQGRVETFYDDFEEYFFDSRKEMHVQDPREFAEYLVAKFPLVRYWEKGCERLYREKITADKLQEMSVEETLICAIRTAMKCRILALKNGRFRTEPEDRDRLTGLLSEMSDEEIEMVTAFAVHGGRSYGQKEKTFCTREEMCEYLCGITDELPAYIAEGCDVSGLGCPDYTDLDMVYLVQLDRLEERLADAEGEACNF